MKRNNLLLGIALSAITSSAYASAPDTEAVEFYNIGSNHYFVTAVPSEAHAIDSGVAGPGWTRTGRSFQAWLSKARAPGDAQPVCRFFSPTANSHFYTAHGVECEYLKSTNTGWNYEGIAFYIQAPVNGRCPAGTVELLRVYNNGHASGEGANHRFVDDASLKDAMVDSRWTAEGAAFCASAKSTGTNANLAPTTTSFESLAGTWKGDAKWEVEVGDQETETRKPLELTLAADGAITGSGNGCTFTGEVSLGDGFRAFFTGTIAATGCADAAFNGDYRKLKLQRLGNGMLLVQMKRGDGDEEAKVQARLTLDGAVTPPGPPPSSSLAGEWTGTVRWEAEGQGVEVQANKPLTLEISSAGAVSGTGFGCTFAGSVTGEVMAAGCEQPLFNGAYRLRLRGDHHDRLKVELDLESGGVEAEIEGVLLAADDGAAPPPPAAPTLVGSWSGTLAWRVGDTSGTDTVSFTIGADGAFSGTAFGCTLAGTLQLSMRGRTVVSGTVTASGCTQAAMNGTFTDIHFEREDGDKLEFELERETNDVKVRLKGKVARTA